MPPRRRAAANPRAPPALPGLAHAFTPRAKATAAPAQDALVGLGIKVPAAHKGKGKADDVASGATSASAAAQRDDPTALRLHGKAQHPLPQSPSSRAQDTAAPASARSTRLASRTRASAAAEQATLPVRARQQQHAGPAATPASPRKHSRPSTPPPPSPSMQPSTPPSSRRARPSTPPPSARAPTSPSLLGAPTRSPLGVRTDPDSGKMFLLVSPRAAAKRRRDAESLADRKREQDAAWSYDDDALNDDEPLFAKRHKVSSASGSRSIPSAALSSEQGAADDDDVDIITPRDVRERPRGLPLVPSLPHTAHFMTPSSGPRALVRPRAPLRPSAFASSTSLPAPALLPFGAAPLYRLAITLPLPSGYVALLALHSALEHALIAHLAIQGPGGSLAPASPISPAGTQDRTISMHSLLPYATLRPLVERASGRRLGPGELARLLTLWGGADADDGIGLTLSRVRALDSRGRKSQDWAVGIRVRLTRRRRETTPPLSAFFGAVKAPTTPGRGGGDERAGEAAREGMSVVALWNTGLEARKTAVREKLLGWTGKAHEAWLDQQGFAPQEEPRKRPQSRPSTPEPRPVVEGAGGLLTPGATREGEGNKRASRIVDLGFGETQPLPTAEKSVSPGWSRPGPHEELAAWHASFPLELVPPIPASELPALLPNTATVQPAPSRKVPQDPLADDEAASGSTLVPGPAPPVKALTLEERIRAKEAARKGAGPALPARSRVGGPSASHVSEAKRSTMAGFKRRSTLSRLSAIAEGVYLLFTSSLPAAGGYGGARSGMLPLADVLGSVTKSSPVALSRAEAREALDMLRDLAPGFLGLSSVGGREWACLEGRELREVREKIREELAAI